MEGNRPGIRAVTGGSEAGVVTGGSKAGDGMNALGWQGIATGIRARTCWGVGALYSPPPKNLGLRAFYEDSS